MNDQEIQEQAKKIIQEKSVNYMQNLKQPINITHAKAFYDGAKWMQESKQWIPITNKSDLPKTSCHCWYFDILTKKIICGRFLNNSKEEVNFILANASHYMVIDEPTPPKLF